MKNKGFTMIELLATITILGILSVIAVTSVTVFINKGKKNFYSSQRNNLISSAKSYYQANKSKLPKDIGTSKSVTYRELKNNKYIGMMYADDRKTECNPDDTKVVVTIVDKNKYKYKGYLSCGTEKDTDTSGTDSSVNFTLQPNALPDGVTYTITINPSNAGAVIKSYSYNVLKNNYTYAGPISDKTNSNSVTTKPFVIDLKDQKQVNNFVISMHVVYALGNKTGDKTIKYTLPMNDQKAPTCTNIKSSRDTWSKDPQTITFSCKDDKAAGGYASGCQKDTYKVVLKTKTDVDKYVSGVKVYDKAGNYSTCNIKSFIRMDFDPPTCPVAKGYIKSSATNVSSHSGLTELASGTWTAKWIFTEASGSKDTALGVEGQGVGGVYYKVTTTGAAPKVTGQKQGYKNVNAEGKSTVTYQACDKLDNCTTSCNTTNVYQANIDRTAPTGITILGYKKKNATNVTSSAGLTNTVKSDNWSDKPLFVLASGSTDAGVGGVYYKSKIEKGKYSKVSYQNVNSSGTTNVYALACDKLNNCQSSGTKYIAKIDMTAPKVTSWTKGSYSDKDTYLKATGKASDSLSGIKYYGIATSTDSSKCTWNNIGKNAANNTFSIGYAKKSGTAKSYYYFVKDAAGNVARSSNKVTQYKLCQLTSYMRDAAVYKMTFNSNDCGDKRKKMNIHNTKCYGYRDKHINVYCYHNMTTKSSETNYGHSGNKTYIYYDTKAHCKRGISEANTYVTQICSDGKFKSQSDHPERFIINHGKQGLEYQFHGFRFFSKACTNSSYCNFSQYMGVWVHQPVTSAAGPYDASHTSSSATAACEKEFKSMSTNYDNYA